MPFKASYVITCELLNMVPQLALGPLVGLCSKTTGYEVGSEDWPGSGLDQIWKKSNGLGMSGNMKKWAGDKMVFQK
jgi:hypothetical protein